jgi:hypothetical protein
MVSMAIEVLEQVATAPTPDARPVEGPDVGPPVVRPVPGVPNSGGVLSPIERPAQLPAGQARPLPPPTPPSPGGLTPDGSTPPIAPGEQPLADPGDAAPPAASPGGPAPQAGAPAFASVWILQVSLLIVGVLLILVIVGAAMRVPNPSGFQHFVFRTALALGVACVVASVPWFLGTASGSVGTAGVAGGAFGVFLLLFLYDPINRFAAGQPAPAPVPVTTDSEPFVFLSYRRGDDLDMVIGRLRERLADAFGQGAIFRDKDTIPLGLDFRKELNDALRHCRVMIAVIGPNWEHLRNEQHVRKLEERGDFVNLEITSVLGRGAPVIPVLVKRTEFPDAALLPASLSTLQFHQRLVLRMEDPDFTNDVERLIEDLRALLKMPPQPA